jgi:2,4-dienoyl-CoA reductase-like NADH-dependent reductase (Old Yellow Enzyme family)
MPSPLFTPFQMREVTLPNRVVVSPMCQYAATDGVANDWHLMHLGQFAVGAAALLFTEATHISPVGRISPRCLGLYSDDGEKELKRVVDFCKQYGVAEMGIQIAHAGRKGSAHPPLDGGGPLTAEAGAWATVAPSALPYADGWHTPKALDEAGLAEVKQQFVDATVRSARAGFTVAELHAGHGYLLHQFLSPISNRREDRYGGDTEGRMRFPLEVFEAVRAAWPKELPLGVRFSATDYVEGGWNLDEAVRFAAALKERGCDFADVTGGGLDPRQKIAVGPGYQVAYAQRIRRETGIATMAVGMITEPRQANDIVAQGQADLVALARGMMFNPRWAWHAAEALGDDAPYSRMYVRAHPSKWPQAFAHRRQAAE